MKKLAALLAGLLALTSMAACSKPEEKTEYPLQLLRVGVKSDVPSFGLQNIDTLEYEGFEIDLAKLLAKELTGDETKVTFTTVTAKTRGPLLDSNELDMVIATYTITEDRKLSYNFSTAYYEDAVGLLVKKDSGIESVADLGSKTIGVARTSTSRASVEQAAAGAGVTGIKFLEFDSYPEIKAALMAGNIDVFSVDRSILKGYLDDTVVLLPDKFAAQSYGVATKLDSELTTKVEELITKWLQDGTIENLKTRWGI